MLMDEKTIVQEVLSLLVSIHLRHLRIFFLYQ
jgi:hypothetical protein